MALIAALAAALAALGSALAVGGHRVGPVAIPPALHFVVLVPALVAVARGRRPVAPRIVIPPAPGKVLRFMLIGVGLLALSTRLPAGVVAGLVAGLTTSAAVAVAVLSFWWPLPAFLRVSVALAMVAVLHPGADAVAHVPALALMGGSAAVALVATARLSTAGVPVLGGARPSPRRRRVAGEAALVSIAMLLGALAASGMDAQRPNPSETRPGAEPRQEQPAPLAYHDVLDPNAAGAGRDGDPDAVLLEVDADRPGVLRALTYDRWDGRRWRRSEAFGTTSTGRAVGFVPVFGDRFERFAGNLSEQRIRIEATYAAVAVGTPRVHSYEVPGAAVVASDGTARFVPALGRGAVYTAQTSRLRTTADELRAAGAEDGGSGRGGGQPDGGGADPTRRRNPALTADPALSERAQALAVRVTAASPTDYDKVTALSDYLAANVTVDDAVGPLAPGTDPVDSVLFPEGPTSPERLATTLAVLTRAVGIPSRLATGFLPGQRPFFGGDFVVRAGDAHTWVEVPFAGVGWQRFDPSGRIAAAERQDSLWSRLKRAWERYWSLVVLLVVLLGAFALRRLVRRRRRLAAIPWVTRFFDHLVRVGAQRGRPRRPAETPGEYTRALAEGVLADDRLVEVGRVVTAAAWSGREPPDDTRRWAEQVLEEAASATRQARTRRRRRRSKAGTST